MDWVDIFLKQNTSQLAVRMNASKRTFPKGYSAVYCGVVHKGSKSALERNNGTFVGANLETKNIPKLHSGEELVYFTMFHIGGGT